MGCRSVTGASSSRGRRLGRRFFDRATTVVARALLGARLVVGSGRSARAVRLVETEAYVTGDPASHAYRGRTRRNAAMFGLPGTLYVYRIHQVHCANIVTRRGEAVLLRAGAVERGPPRLASGPGRLCRYLRLTRRDDGRDVTTDLRLRLTLTSPRVARVVVGRRIGIRKAVRRRLRFAVPGDVAVSSPRPPGWRTSAASPSRSRAGGPSRQSRTRRRRPSGGGRRGGRSAGR